MENNPLSLLQLNQQIKLALKSALPYHYWVTAEISELKENTHSKHCYLELIEKDKHTEQIIARSRGTIWTHVYRILKPYFETSTGQPFQSGINILIKVSVEFHELYGLSLNITDIDPVYTLGDIARKRRETLSKLEEQGVIDLNKSVPFSSVPQRVAIISSKNAAGYQDFMEHIRNNPYGYHFYLKLFDSVMQGKDAEKSIIHSLDQIFEYEQYFDVVVIIRGGGAQADLNCFDNYWLAYHAAQFPIPIITGIGHEKDDTVLDIIANTKLKTPTAAAEFLIQQLNHFEKHLFSRADQITELLEHQIHKEKERLTNSIGKFPFIVSKIIHNQTQKLDGLTHTLHKHTSKSLQKNAQKLQHLNFQINQNALSRFLSWKKDITFKQIKTSIIARSYFQHQHDALNHFTKSNQYLDPGNILKKGFSITYHEGQLITDISQVEKNQMIRTHLTNGILISKVKDKKELS